MRICPGNIIQPALLEAGVQGLWTPAVNYRIGRSGCQPNCIACGQVCPTAAIRPLSLDEKQGAGRVRRPGADPHGHGLRGPRPLSALGHGPALSGLS